MNSRYYTCRDTPSNDEFVSDSSMLLANAAGYAEYRSSFDVNRTRSE